MEALDTDKLSLAASLLAKVAMRVAYEDQSKTKSDVGKNKQINDTEKLTA